MSLVVFGGVGRGTEKADQGVAPRSRPVRTSHSRLYSCNVSGQLDGQIYPRLVNRIPGTSASAYKTMGDGHFAVVAMSTAHRHLQSSGEVFENVSVESGVQLLPGHRQNVVENVLPGLGVQH